ncbi:helix-turn-helix domain-containing protein [Massilia sp. ST3]|uniref:helix-turn-helix domain-containing protein n=1 Tax=Massilia sp. ST3 TaxID=2824903 RepID=UPI001B8155A1|nr:helix-turn-helix transcriptional regulator [Massilia sp. ST3]MBQ5949374.1 helix-turn-helix transcriptional regulator [Massilia sp. ST3]
MDALASPAGAQYFSDFAAALRYWRGKRGISQLRLSVDSGISQRHLSFLETGRAQPGKDLILKLGLALDIPLRQRNAMLLAAGFAPAYRERNLEDPDMEAVKRALEFMLHQQSPYPALVVDRLWNLVMANEPAARMMRFFLGLPAHAPIPRDGSVNVIRMTLDPNGLRPALVNWEEVCTDQLQWVQREAMGDGPGSEAARLLDELVALPGIAQAASQPNLDRLALPFMPITLRKDEVSLKLFTTITTLGTPHDVTVHELRLEAFFPADEASRRWFEGQA